MRIFVGTFLALVLISSICVNNVFGEKFDKKSCIAKIPKDAGFAMSNKMRQDCEDKERGLDSDKHLAIEKKRLDEWTSKKLLGICNEWYDEYKILGDRKFQEWVISQVAGAKGAKGHSITTPSCIDLWKDPVWNYKGKDREQKILDWLIQYSNKIESKEKIAKAKSTGSVVGNVKTPDLEELEKRINKKLEKLEKENKQLKEQLKKIKTTNTK